jgi:hypothetical protein
MDALVIGLKLKIGHAFVEHAAFERLAVRGLDSLADDDWCGRRHLGTAGPAAAKKKERMSV